MTLVLLMVAIFHVGGASMFACALEFTYLSARRSPDESALRKALGWLGGLALLLAAAAVAADSWINCPRAGAIHRMVIGGCRRDAVWNTAAIAWTFALVAINSGNADRASIWVPQD